MGSFPGWRAKIPHGSWPKNQIIKQKHYCNKFNKDFKHGPHQKNTKILRGRGGGKALSFSLHCQVQPSVNRLLIGLSYGTQFPRDNSQVGLSNSTASRPFRRATHMCCAHTCPPHPSGPQSHHLPAPHRARI